ncbi:MAG: HutD family protein [Candidatus Devosia phytovorans]|uniref:HutD family protein n=1 Tax=Candidatus Devosia phytovorans TaxID=3121372 RepID=A0AAJ5VUA7_9HYPH|nr:HutD family protein [Devosia sp.]WEK04919.1 MAG: HutD family protein [Devosia sp.]
MRLLRYEDLSVTPWKNGGGVTREVASCNDGDVGLLWRVSIATVSAPGPFSSFSGIDRTIAVLAGKGMDLSTSDHAVTLTSETPPYDFDGETPIHARLTDGDTTDLNAMSRRGHFRHRMLRLTVNPGFTFIGTAQLSFIVLGGPAEIAFDGKVINAGPLDTVADIAQGASLAWGVAVATPCHLIEFDPVY